MPRIRSRLCSCGLMDSQGKLNIRQTQKIVDFAGDMEVIFHRAIDMCKNRQEVIDILISLGIFKMLT